MAGFAEFIVEFTSSTKLGKTAKQLRAVAAMSVVLVGKIEEVMGLPTAYCGEKVWVMGDVVGTICGLAGSDARFMVSPPMRICAVCNCALLRSMENPSLLNPVNGVVVPAGQVTCKLAGVHT